MKILIEKNDLFFIKISSGRKKVVLNLGFIFSIYSLSFIFEGILV